MADVTNILDRKEKGKRIFSIGPKATVKEAAMRMNEYQIGALVVLDGDRLAGIFTERDVLRRVVAEGRDPAATTVEQVMTRDVLCCQRSTEIDQVRSLLMTRRIRHLPVLDEQNQVIGMVSIGDINAWQLDGQEVTIQNLQEYIYGRV